jgi:Ribosomal protein S15
LITTGTGGTRGLERCINQRRKLLQYLRRSDFDAYIKLLPRLGLKDVFAKMDRLTLQATARHVLHGPVRTQKKSKSR